MSLSSARPTVLLVDDDAASARVLAHMLREDGYDVEVVLDGVSAVGRLSRDPAPDVLVTDYRIPHLDGLAVARFARSRSSHTFVMMVTSYPEVVARLVRDQPDAPLVLGKPLAYAELKGRLPPALAIA